MNLKKILFYFIIFLQIQLFAQYNSLDEILKEKELRVCVWPEYYWISYLDIRTQQFIGIDSDLAKELAKDLGVNLKFLGPITPLGGLLMITGWALLILIFIKNKFYV